MPRKLLTAIDRQVAAQTTAQVVMTVAVQQQLLTRTAIEETIKQTAQKEGLRFLNVQRLTRIQHMLDIVHQYPIIPPPERRGYLTGILTPPTEEQELLTKRQITLQQEQKQEIFQRDVTRLEKWLQEVQERLLSPIALNLIDHTVLCMLDKLLWETNPTIVSQITQQLVEMCEKKSSRIRPLIGYEALQKHMLQLYIPMFMSFPYTLNMLALRLSQLTIPLLRNKWMQYYYMGALPTQAMKQKAQLQCCETRRLETKAVSSGSTTRYVHPHKFKLNAYGMYEPEQKVGVPKDFKGKELLFMGLRYAYRLPYWVRRFIAIHLGMPENSKYALYFGIGGMPTRRSRWKGDYRRYPELKYVTYHRDEHVRNLIAKYQTRRRAFYTTYKRYYRTEYERSYGKTRYRH